MKRNSLLIITTLFSLLCPLPCLAQEEGIPDFAKCFETLETNRTVYNQYNDSIFLIRDHEQWVSFFRRRAQKNHEIYDSNKEAIKTITSYFDQEASRVEHRSYPIFREAFKEYVGGSLSDPFLILQLGKVLERHYAVCDSAVCRQASFMLNIWFAANFQKISQLGNDTAYVRKSYEYFKMNIHAADEHRCTDVASYIYSLWNLTKTTYIYNKVESLDEYYAARGRLRELMAQDTVKAIFSKKTYAAIMNSLQTADETLLRNIYMTDTTVMDKHLADSLMTAIVEQNLSKKSILAVTHIRTLLMQVKLGQITAKEALEIALDRYKMYRKLAFAHMLNIEEFLAYLEPFNTFFYLNDMADIPWSRKCANVRRMCKDIEAVYKNRKDEQYSMTGVRYLNRLTTYPRVVKYLSPKERIAFLNSLNVATQVTTYAHSVHVSMIASTLMEGILQYKPELLVGTMGYNLVEDVRRDRAELLNFVHDAAMYHDLGKNSIISVVNNDYRPLTDEEFAIIKRHPELGLQFLELAPDLAKYHDTTLGHHKWYNGIGGVSGYFRQYTFAHAHHDRYRHPERLYASCH